MLHAVVWKIAGKSMGLRAVRARDCDEMIPISKIWKDWEFGGFEKENAGESARERE